MMVRVAAEDGRRNAACARLGPGPRAIAVLVTGGAVVVLVLGVGVRRAPRDQGRRIIEDTHCCRTSDL